MNGRHERELQAGLRALAGSARDAGASARVERAVLAAFPQRARRRSSRMLPLAAALLLCVGAALWLVRPQPQDARVEVAPLSGFVAIPLAAALPEMESASVIRVTLPVSVLPAYGVAIVPEMTRDAVQADLLVAQDGHPRAIRLVDLSTTIGSTP